MVILFAQVASGNYEKGIFINGKYMTTFRTLTEMVRWLFLDLVGKLSVTNDNGKSSKHFDGR